MIIMFRCYLDHLDLLVSRSFQTLHLCQRTRILLSLLLSEIKLETETKRPFLFIHCSSRSHPSPTLESEETSISIQETVEKKRS